MKSFAITVGLCVFLTGCIDLQYHIIRDCGWFALLRGSELLWLFGACHH